MRLVDGDGDDVLVGDPGELLVRGPNVFAGYWNDQEATDRVITADGWLRTGDVGVVDDDGNVYLVDRAKDLIIVSGFNVFPAEVEEIICEMPGVAECAVVGVADALKGQVAMAFVVLRDPSKAAATDARLALEGELMATVDKQLGAVARPSRVHFVGSLPKTRSGKVLRRSIQAICEARDPGDLTTIEDPSALEQVRQALGSGA